MKKIVALFIATLLLLTLSMSVLADYTPGVTTVADPESPTGFTTTIVFEAPGAEAVTLSGSFAFYKDDGTRAASPETYYTPEQWEDGMFALGQETHKMPMEKVEGTDYFVKELQLPSGHYQYAFYVDNAETRVDDPTNPGQYSLVENGGKYTRSVFDVPYDAEKQPKSQDYIYAAKRTDGKVGEVTYVGYTDFEGNPQSMGIYLPYGYDANRAEPYKVLYLSHGGGGDETFWVGGGASREVFDNAIVDGAVEPTIVVTMNNQIYGWDYTGKLIPNLFNAIIPYMEANYNVSKEASGRAYAGLSMGGMTTTNMYYHCTESFGYYGIISGTAADLDFASKDIDVLKAPTIMISAGFFDSAHSSADPTRTNTAANLCKVFDDLGIEYGYHEFPGGHEWFTWIQSLNVFARNYLWK